MTCQFLIDGRCSLAEMHAREELDVTLECRPSAETCSACLASGTPKAEKPSVQCVGLVTAQVGPELLPAWRKYVGWILFGKSRGLGDTIAKITKATGVEAAVKVVAKAAGKDCGCKKRQKAMNAAKPYSSSQ